MRHVRFANARSINHYLAEATTTACTPHVIGSGTVDRTKGVMGREATRLPVTIEVRFRVAETSLKFASATLFLSRPHSGASRADRSRS
jgi:hypothetical protein